MVYGQSVALMASSLEFRVLGPLEVVQDGRLLPERCAEALNEDRLDRGLLLARAGVDLQDSARTRSNLLAAVLRKPPAMLGVLGGTADAASQYPASAPRIVTLKGISEPVESVSIDWR